MFFGGFLLHKTAPKKHGTFACLGAQQIQKMMILQNSASPGAMHTAAFPFPHLDLTPSGGPRHVPSARLVDGQGGRESPLGGCERLGF